MTARTEPAPLVRASRRGATRALSTSAASAAPRPSASPWALSPSPRCSSSWTSAASPATPASARAPIRRRPPRHRRVGRIGLHRGAPAQLADGPQFLRRAGGIVAIGLFIWGVFALNEADWRLGDVDFSHTTLRRDHRPRTDRGLLRQTRVDQPLRRGRRVAGAGVRALVYVNFPLWLREGWDRRCRIVPSPPPAASSPSSSAAPIPARSPTSSSAAKRRPRRAGRAAHHLPPEHRPGLAIVHHRRWRGGGVRANPRRARTRAGTRARTGRTGCPGRRRARRAATDGVHHERTQRLAAPRHRDC